MAETAVHKPAAENRGKTETEKAEQAAVEVPKRPPIWRRLTPKKIFTKKVLLGIVVISIIGHGVAYWYTQVRATQIKAEQAHELPLGRFSFAPHNVGPDGIAEAKFDLHVSLLSDHATLARGRLKTQQFEVQQNIEELLRKARSEDFTDPTLGELKRLLQETINETIAKRAIRDVIITDFVVTHAEGSEQTPVAKQAEEPVTQEGPW